MIWVEPIAAIALWVFVLWQIIQPNSLLDRDLWPRCTGCQRHFIKPGCPVHDEKRTAA